MTELYYILKEEGAALEQFGHGLVPEGSDEREAEEEQIVQFREKWDTLEKLE